MGEFSLSVDSLEETYEGGFFDVMVAIAGDFSGVYRDFSSEGDCIAESASAAASD